MLGMTLVLRWQVEVAVAQVDQILKHRDYEQGGVADIHGLDKGANSLARFPNLKRYASRAGLLARCPAIQTQLSVQDRLCVCGLWCCGLVLTPYMFYSGATLESNGAG